MNKIEGFYMDTNGNKWSDYYYGEYEAELLSKSLFECKNCTNCEKCTDCVECVECFHCVSAKNCKYCKHLCCVEGWSHDTGEKHWGGQY